MQQISSGALLCGNLGGALALSKQLQFGVIDLDLRRNATSAPVVNTLDSTGLLVVSKQSSDLRRAPEQINDFCVVHGTALNTTFKTESTLRESTFCLVRRQFLMAIEDDSDSAPHPSMQRLLSFATEATAHKKMKVSDWATLLAALNAGKTKDEKPITAGRFSNWKSKSGTRKGLSMDGALMAQRIFGCSANWLLTGAGEARAGGDGPPVEPKGDFSYKKASSSQWAVLRDLDDIAPKERERIIADIHERAENYREHLAEALSKMKGDPE